MLRPVNDAAVAHWIVEIIHPFAQDVGSVVPEGFDAYARVFHPAGKQDGDTWTAVEWSNIAAANGKRIAAKTCFADLVPTGCFDEDGLHWRRGQPGLWDWPPSEGELPEDLAAELIRILSRHTQTPGQCVFAYWAGWGDPTPTMPLPRTEQEKVEQDRFYKSYKTGAVFAGTPRAQRDVAATVSLPGRDYRLFEGDVAEARTDWSATAGQLPSLWWPADRAWCVATEVDFDWTYVGGSAECIDEVLATPKLEALEMSASDKLAGS